MEEFEVNGKGTIKVFRFLRFTEQLERFLTQVVVAGLVMLVVSQVVLQRDASPLFNYGDWMAGNSIWQDPEAVPTMAGPSAEVESATFATNRGTVTLLLENLDSSDQLEIWINNQPAASFRNGSLVTLAVRPGDRITLLATGELQDATVRVVAHSRNIVKPSIGSRIVIQAGRTGFEPVQIQ